MNPEGTLFPVRNAAAMYYSFHGKVIAFMYHHHLPKFPGVGRTSTANHLLPEHHRSVVILQLCTNLVVERSKVLLLSRGRHLSTLICTFQRRCNMCQQPLTSQNLSEVSGALAETMKLLFLVIFHRFTIVKIDLVARYINSNGIR